MSEKEARALVRHWFEEYNKGKAAAMAVIDELVATDFVWHRGTGEVIHGLKDYKQSQAEFFSAFPDLHFTIDDMVVERDRVATRWTMTGTHKGERWDIPATNKKVTVVAINIGRIAGGKLMELWERWDTLGLMQQLGAGPTPAKGR
jgi:steroid delta-isomerase-like uncharacterized protein